MNHLNVNSEASFLQLPESLTTSPSQSTFMAEEDASICPLLHNTSSPQLQLQLDYSHPLTPSTGIVSDNPDDQVENDDTSSSSSSSGIGITSAIGIGTNYHHLHKNGDLHHQENGNGKKKKHGNINFDYLNALNIPLTKDLPSFVKWNWPLIRKVTFFIFLSGIFAMCSIVVGMIYNLPRICSPDIKWYQGSIFYEIFPASFKDSDGSSVGDLRGIADKVSYFQNLSIGAIRLNSIFSAKNYPEDYTNIDTLMNITKELGTMDDMKYLVSELHSKNISLILDLPLYPLYTRLEPSTTMNNLTRNNNNNANDMRIDEYRRVERGIIDNNGITNVMRFWLAHGIDGFYLKGLENFADDEYLMENIREWKYVLGSDRIMIVNESLIKSVSEDVADEILECIDLIDVFLDITNGTRSIEHKVDSILKGKLKPSENGPWIHWSINGIDKRRMSTAINQNASLAGLLMELMLPGTPNIFYGDELSMGDIHDPDNVHAETKHLHHLPTMPFTDQSVKFTNQKVLPWLPKSALVSYEHLEYVIDAGALRKATPGLHMNSINKDGNKAFLNTHIRANKDDLLIIERTFPRRNTIVSITNLGSENLSLDISAFYYSGELALGPAKKSKVFFNNFKIASLETIIVKLDK
ncbi:maltase A1-like [Chironomus tepperi]|uniref:maltase A1-like n=1 Tax=Chironomus tepperi TaxID=113505 RepID=UPI00391F8CB9